MLHPNRKARCIVKWLVGMVWKGDDDGSGMMKTADRASEINKRGGESERKKGSKVMKNNNNNRGKG